jgi:hypothetical protein
LQIWIIQHENQGEEREEKEEKKEKVIGSLPPPTRWHVLPQWKKLIESLLMPSKKMMFSH